VFFCFLRALTAGAGAAPVRCGAVVQQVQVQQQSTSREQYIILSLPPPSLAIAEIKLAARKSATMDRFAAMIFLLATLVVSEHTVLY